MEASAIVVGDEILSGHVRDANGPFIAERVAHHGHRLRRISVVPDDPAEIAEQLRRDLVVAAIVFVCGGVGPTHDDRTMEGVAEALGVALEPCAALAERIEDLAAQLGRQGFSDGAFGIESLRKMALAPAGSVVLPTAIGIIPAVTVEASAGARVVVLPGPPREMQAVFTEAVEPRYLAGRGTEVWREEITHPFPESTVADALRALEAVHAGITVGSYPQRDHVVVRIAGPARAARAAADSLRADLDALARSDEGKRLLSFLVDRRVNPQDG